MENPSENTQGQQLPKPRGILLGNRRCPATNRIVAEAIDLVVVAAIFYVGKVFMPLLGVFVAAGYAFFKDAQGRGQSIGKRLSGLRVVDAVSEQACSWSQSFQRNLPLGAAVLVGAFPILWLLLVLVIPLLGLEIYLITHLATGVRLGDLLGDTLVIEADPPVPVV